VLLACDGPAGSDAPRGPAARLRLAGTPLEGPAPPPDFVLTDTAGEPFDFAHATRGFVTLLYFGYTSCPDVCPVHLANIAAALHRSPPDVRRGVKVVFVGVDPARDTPPRLREWLDHFDPGFVGLTGSPEDLEAAQRAAGVPPAFAEATGDDYAVSHAGWVLLLTPDNRPRLRYPLGTRQKQWAHDLEVLVRQGWPDA
jgi:protein SCO1/2